MPNDLANTRIHVVLDNIRSAYNVGSIFRTADATGCAMLHICGLSAYPPNLKLEKTALGAIESVPWKYYKNTQEALSQLQKQNIPIFAIEKTQNSADYTSTTYPDPLALILGHEIHGVSEFALDAADKIIHIPMHGKKSSLNVATAAGIILYEVIR